MNSIFPLTFRLLLYSMLIMSISSCSWLEKQHENDLIQLMQIQESAVEYELSNINNLDVLKGFRGVKIGTHLDSLFVDENIFNINEHDEYNLKTVSSVFDHNNIEIYLGDMKINVLSLFFIDDMLRSISLTFRNNDETLDQNRFLSQLSNMFGVRNSYVNCDYDRQLSSYHDYDVPIEVIDSASWVSKNYVLNLCYTKDLEAYNYYGGRLRYQLSYLAKIEYLDKGYVDEILEIRAGLKEKRLDMINQAFQRTEDEKSEQRMREREERIRQDMNQF